MNNIILKVPWPEIQSLLKTAQSNNDRIASSIKQLKLEKNHIAMTLHDPYAETTSDSDEDEKDFKKLPRQLVVDIDLGLSAYANARRYK